MTAKADFGVDRSKTGGRRSYCKACDRRRGRAYYDAHKDDLYAQREAVREAAWQAELEALAGGHRKRVAAAKKLHAALVRRQKEFMRSIGVPDLTPEEVMERARRRAQEGRPLAYREEAG
jgi:RecB family exonuclease